MTFNLKAYSMRNPVRTLLLVNAGVSLLLWLAMGLQTIFGLSDRWAFILFSLPADPMQALIHPWTSLTYMVAQVNPLQLLFNMLWLYWFSMMLLDTDSPSQLYLLYLGGGLSGAACYLLANTMTPGSGTYLMGSSAAVLSVMVYTAFRQPDRRVPLFILGEIPLKYIAVVTVVITLAGGTGIASHCAHIGGTVFPLLLIGLRRWRYSRPAQRTPRRRVPEAFIRRGPLIHKDGPPETAGSPEEILDTLLDKIKSSGFDSLSEKEKKLLDDVSRQLGK